MHRMVLCTYGWNVQYGASRKLGYSPTNSSGNGSPPTDIMSASTLLASGATNGAPVVDDFGVKYVGKEHAEHLVASLKTKYKLVEDWDGDLYCGIKLHWDYTARTLDMSMPGYV